MPHPRAPRFTALAALALLAAAPTSRGATSADTQVVARQGNETLTAADVRKLLAQLDPTARAHLLATQGGVENLVRSRLAADALLAEANGRNWSDRPEVARDIVAARDTVIARTYLASVSAPDASFPSDAAIAAAYDAHKAQFAVPRQFHLQQVILPGADDAAGRRHAQATARAFPASGAQDTGFLPENRLVEPILAALSGLAVGNTAVVHLDDGWHVLKLVAIRPATTLSLPQVRDQVAAVLRHDKAEANARAYLDALEARQHPQIDEIALSSAAK